MSGRYRFVPSAARVAQRLGRIALDCSAKEDDASLMIPPLPPEAYERLAHVIISALGLDDAEVQHALRLVTRMVGRITPCAVPAAFLATCCIVHRVASDEDITTRDVFDDLHALPVPVSSALLGTLQVRALQLLDYRLLV